MAKPSADDFVEQLAGKHVSDRDELLRSRSSRGGKSRSRARDFEDLAYLPVMLMIALVFHRPCVEALVGRSWDCSTVVSTSRRERATAHPLADLISGMPLNIERVHLATTRPPASDRQVRADWYGVPAPAPVAGRHVVLFEDTWVSGASAQSAVLALRRAGAAAVTVVCLARWFEESNAYPLERTFFEGLTTPYDAAICPASGLVCGQPDF